MRYISILFISLLFIASEAYSAERRDLYDPRQCEGSLTPYPDVFPSAEYPDSLEVVFINHVGRHGSRYPASSSFCRKLLNALDKAEKCGSITETGKKLRSLTKVCISESEGKWGDLDTLGVEEQRGIATRMLNNYPSLFGPEHAVDALSSYSPRAMMSMYSFTHCLDQLNTKTTFRTLTGRSTSPLMRPFDTVKAYLSFCDKNIWQNAYDKYFAEVCPVAAIKRALGDEFPGSGESELRDLTFAEWAVVAGCPAMSIETDLLDFFTIEELNEIWSCFNLRQYLRYSASSLSTIPADIASELLRNLITTTDDFISGKERNVTVRLRFGHAETLMPLLSLMKLRGCYYISDNLHSVADYWRDFDIVPMAANIQLVLFRSRLGGQYYLRVALNERFVPLLPGSSDVIIPWTEARKYLLGCLPS